MMRLTMAVWWSLALVWLLTSQADAESGHAQLARHEEIPGHGPSLEVAKQVALRNAVQKLQDELRRQQLDHWQPTERVVKEHLLDGPGKVAADVADPVAGPQKTWKTWVIGLKIPSNEELRNMDRQAQRHEVSEARMSLALRVVAALAAVLTIIIGCIRADEWTSSRYTAWLRAAGAGLIAAVVAGWWWMR